MTQMIRFFTLYLTLVTVGTTILSFELPFSKALLTAMATCALKAPAVELHKYLYNRVQTWLDRKQIDAEAAEYESQQRFENGFGL